MVLRAGHYGQLLRFSTTDSFTYSRLLQFTLPSIVGSIYNIQLLKYAGEDGVVIYGLMMYVSLIFSAIFVGYSNGATGSRRYHY